MAHETVTAHHGNDYLPLVERFCRSRLAERLGLDPGALRGYGKRAQTRSDHLAKVAEYLSWKTAPGGGREVKELEQFLLDRAMEHDSPTLLFNLAREYLACTG